MPDQRRRPPLAADERTQLLGWLALQRQIVRLKCEDLSEADAHRSVLPSSPLMTVAGLVRHLRWVEHAWFEVKFLDRSGADNPQFSGVKDDGMRAAGIPLAHLLDDYARQCAVSDEIVAAHSLDDVGRNRERAEGDASLRWMLLHMLEETARHAGHLDAIRELIDGRTGYW
ncbi:DinB family protein [Streptomyces profundus]|uniref:DinB family protein n=1 Tax=Streptomyces profundus TaxID=2867410 RepID=UPI001D169B73|nr:DinB family protein [Streptomyces sp. MA3_2.13]UED87358.1 DinB family protein [Streptomyces sp. MA3_2.13]